MSLAQGNMQRMESSTAIAIVLRPIVTPILFCTCVAPIAWLLYRVFPSGRLKVLLFKDRSGAQATRRDKVLLTVAIVVAFVVMIGWAGYLGGRGP